MTDDATWVLSIEAGQRHRQFAGDAFPLAIGGDDAAVELAGVPGALPAAWLGLATGKLFIQVEDGPVRVTCNGRPLTASRWLCDGDQLAIGETQIDVAVDGDRFCLHVTTTAVISVTPAATSTRGAAHGSGGTIQPLAFTPRASASAPRDGRRMRPLVVLTAGMFAALAAIVWVLFSLAAVGVQIDPPTEQVSFSGAAPFGWHLGGRYLLWPGTYTLVARHDGYRALETSVEVTGETNQVFRFTLEKLPGLLRIDAGDVTGAEVLIDGQTVGATPLEPVELAAGEHQVMISSASYEPFTTRVVIEGKGIHQTVTARWIPRWAAVTFQSTPPGASIHVDGKAVGTTPAQVDLLAGTHQVELRLAGYQVHVDTLDVTANEPRTLGPVRLDLEPGMLHLTSTPSAAMVRVDGQFRGQTPLDLRLTPKQAHEVVVSRAGYDTVSRAVQLAPGQQQELSVALPTREGAVQISALPADAELFVNGKPFGRASQTVHLPAVPQQIEIRADGFSTYRTTLTPRPELEQSLDVALESLVAEPVVTVAPTAETSQRPALVRVTGGRFRMGAPRREPGRRANETLRDVELTRPFYLGTREVSNGQFRKFDDAHLSGAAGKASLERDDHPVVQVTWDDAARYCNWLSQQESLPAAYRLSGGRLVAVSPLTTGYRLPTEAEWSMAARLAAGPPPRKYPWGPSLPVPAGAGNFADDAAAGLLTGTLENYHDGFPATSPVDSFAPNALGLYNMGGNVAEWMHDIYTIYSPGEGQTERDPVGAADGDLHVIRGSSWRDASVSALRLTYRDYGKKARTDVGFRIARYVR